MPSATDKTPNLKTCKAKRDGYRVVVKNLIDEKMPTDEDGLRGYQSRLERYMQLLNQSDGAVQELLPESEIAQDVIDSSGIHDQLLNIHASVVASVAKFAQQDGSQTSTGTTAIRKSGSNVKLPKLMLAKFDGNPLKFKSFMDSFTSSVDQNEDLSDIDKFNYLKGLLTGKAELVIEGLEVTSETYGEALQLLRLRYGRKQAVIDAHVHGLLAIPVCNETNLMDTFDAAERHIRGLGAMGIAPGTYGTVIAPILLSKFPDDVQYVVGREHKGDTWDLDMIRDILRSEITAREKGPVNFRHLVPASASKEMVPTGTKPPTAGSLNTSVQKTACAFCDGSHVSAQCPLPPADRCDRARERNLCFCCLRPGHGITRCRSTARCQTCNGRHNTMICMGKKLSSDQHKKGDKTDSNNKKKLDPTARVFTPTSDKSKGQADQGAKVAQGNFCSQSTVRRQIANVCIKSYQKRIRIDVCFDTAGDRTLITQDAAKKLKAKHVGKETLKIVGCGAQSQGTQDYDVVKVGMQCLNHSWKYLDALVVPEIMCTLTETAVGPDVKHFFKGYKLAYPFSDRPEIVTVDMLVGLDHYWEFVHGPVKAMPGGPTAIYSDVGWLISGKVKSEATRSCVSPNLFVHCERSPDLNESLQNFWKLETLGLTDGHAVKDKEVTEINQSLCQRYEDTVTHDNGRYAVDLLWKDRAADVLPDNRGKSLARFWRLMENLEKTPNVLKMYDDYIQEQERLGIIEKVDENLPPDGVLHYIAHKHVLREGSATMKIRVVYDASARLDKHSPSLNDCLHAGPDMMGDLFDMLIRFRQFSVGIIADIEKAFLMIGLHQNQRDCTRFFWRGTKPGSIQVYRFQRVVFGVICSPFLLNYTLQHHLRKYDTGDARLMAQNLYMDNLVVSVKSTGDAEKLYSNGKIYMDEAGMNLREWKTNSKDMNLVFAPSDRYKSDKTKVLGLTWDCESDSLKLQEKHAFNRKASTKRSILAELSSVYDPLGFLSPITVKGKCLMQKLWKEKLGWDDMVSSESMTEWERLFPDLAAVSEIDIPRSMNLDSCANIQIHAFSDASQLAYGAVVYLRKQYEDKTSTSFVCSKARVAPIQPCTIPKLELLATVVASRLIQKVKKALTIAVNDVYLWSDSQIALQWIASKKYLPQFIQNRVAEVRNADAILRYVPTGENPADMLSRGLSLEKLKSNDMWFHGPTWLSQDEDHWPEWVASKDDDEAPTANVQVFKVGAINPPYGIDYDRYGTLGKLLRITVYCTRAVNRLRGQQTNLNMTVKELRAAEMLWIKYVQSVHFGPEIDAAARQVQLKGLSTQLGLYLDERGILRSKGRVEKSKLHVHQRNPVVLPKQDKLTELVIGNVHKTAGHAKTRQTLAQLRMAYWVPSGRQVVQKWINRCVRCRRWDGRPYAAPPAPPLPAFRVSDAPAFTYTGVDYAGPLHAKDGDKAWICLFTCASTRAVHLELATDMTTEQFMVCLRRFIARRGTPSKLISDNATQFKAADKLLEKLWKQVFESKDVHDNISAKGIAWVFNVERAPWWGGFFERMIGIVKQAFKRVVGQSRLSFREIDTVLIEVEAIVNSRPLTYVYGDRDEGHPLTPHDLMGYPRPTGFPQCPSDEDDPYYVGGSPDTVEQVSRRLRYHQDILDRFWSTWRHEYLLQLRENALKRSKAGIRVNIGDVVLLGDDLPRAQWKMGKVTEVMPGRDNFIRAVKVKTSTGTLGRPVQLLYPLEVSNQVHNHEKDNDQDAPEPEVRVRPKRRAAEAARNAIRRGFRDESPGAEDV